MTRTILFLAGLLCVAQVLSAEGGVDTGALEQVKRELTARADQDRQDLSSRDDQNKAYLESRTKAVEDNLNRKLDQLQKATTQRFDETDGAAERASTFYIVGFFIMASVLILLALIGYARFRSIAATVIADQVVRNLAKGGFEDEIQAYASLEIERLVAEAENEVKEKLQATSKLAIDYETQLREVQEDQRLLSEMIVESVEAEDLRMKLARFEETLTEFKTEPEFTEADWFLRGTKQNSDSDYEEAIESLSKAIELDSDYTNAYNNRGISYAELGHPQKAINDYSNAIELGPDYAIAYSNRGVMYAALGEDQRAIDDYNRAIQLDPEYTDAYSNRGNRYAALGEDQRAIDDYNRAIETDPDYTDAYHNRGVRYAAIGEDQKAINDYDIAIELDPEDTDAYSNRGNRYAAMGEDQKALDDYNKAIELDPDCADAYGNRGVRYAALGEDQKAIDDYNRAIELDPEYTDAYNNRGNRYAALGEDQKAIDDYNRAIELDPEYSGAFLNLTELYIITGDFDRGIQVLQNMPTSGTDSSTQTIYCHLQFVLHELRDQDASRFELRLTDALAKQPKLTWSFDTFENWLNTAAISEEKKQSLHAKTQLMKKCN